MASVQPSQTDTKARILEAAERLFVERGFAGSSLRAITNEAGVNVAAVHYHFGGREELLRAVLHRRVDPVNQARFAALDALEQTPSVEAILHAFVDPTFAAARTGKLPQVAALLFHEPTAKELVSELFGELAERMESALAQALPDMPHRVLRDRLQFVVGAVVFELVGHRPLGPDRPRGMPSLAMDLVAFLAAGIRAPHTGDSE
jgi:AcrR family transcriptional regulator